MYQPDACDPLVHDYGKLMKTSLCKPTDMQRQYFLMQTCYELIPQPERYDLIVRSRHDIWIDKLEFINPGPNEIVCTLRNNRARPTCDCMFYGQPAAMAKATSLRQHFPDCIYWLRQTELISEDMLAEHYKRVGLKTIDSDKMFLYLLRHSGHKERLSR